MATDRFVKIDGIPGESTDGAHPDWIEVLKVRHKMEQPASSTASSAGGATAARVDHFPYEFVHLVDLASPKLRKAACTGEHIKEIVFSFNRAGGEKFQYEEVTLGQSIITSVELVDLEGVKEGFQAEKVSISYGTIKWKYTQQKRDDGSGGGNVVTGWDAKANKAIA